MCVHYLSCTGAGRHAAACAYLWSLKARSRTLHDALPMGRLKRLAMACATSITVVRSWSTHQAHDRELKLKSGGGHIASAMGGRQRCRR